jgi:aldose 1-epimerase
VDRLTIANEAIEAELLPELGARLHRLRAFGQDLLRTPDDIGAYTDEPFFWGSFVMAPWCNRLQVAPSRVGTQEVRLRPNFPDGTAIHGEVYRLPWERLADGTMRVQAGGDEWPWEYEVVQTVAVDDQVLRLDQSLTNLSTEPMPAGIGIHPWFMRPALIRIRAAAVYPRNTEAGAKPDPVAGRLDLRELQAIPDGLDATWTELGAPPVELSWPNLGVSATMRVAADTVFIVAATLAAFSAVAVEPQTHAPHGLRRLLNRERGAMAMIGPAGSLRMTVELEFARLTDS